MLKSGRARLCVIAFLLIILTGLFIWYGSLSPDPDNGNYPHQEHLIEDYDGYVGEEVELTGDVIETGPVKIEAEHGDETIVLTITDVEKDVEKGDRLSVYGVVKEDKTIKADNTVVHPPINYAYMYLISSVAAVWVFTRIVRQWRWDSQKAALKVREEPLEFKDLPKILKRKIGQGDEKDG
ncbi:MAG: hypothetical protein KGY76_08415 [Candidatus Thermoplasmatota archaeon]|nr:hypothetical protein [Candidatus Thermoplasmatota archaeon]